MCVCVHVLMRDERRKEERSKQGHKNNKAKLDSLCNCIELDPLFHNNRFSSCFFVVITGIIILYIQLWLQSQ